MLITMMLQIKIMGMGNENRKNKINPDFTKSSWRKSLEMILWYSPNSINLMEEEYVCACVCVCVCVCVRERERDLDMPTVG